MANKPSDKSKEKDLSAIIVEQQEEESAERALARAALSPTLQSAITVRDYGKSLGELELMSLVDELKHQVGQTIDGNLERAEAMLTTQAHTLDAIFNNLARRTMHAKTMDGFDMFLKLGLRAQSQCRATWETLAVIKNPLGRTYVNQANFAHNQQINNDKDSTRMREKRIPPNELLENTENEPDKWLDQRSPEKAVRTDQDMETVEEIDRPEDA